MTRDWSDGHMVYSAPSSMAHAWKLQAEPRYMLQWRRRTAAAQRAERGRRNPPRPSSEPRVDWGYQLLAGGTSGLGQYPAKFTFDIYATPDCTNDFVVFNQAGLAGAAPTVAAAQTGTFTGEPTTGQIATITNSEGTVAISRVASRTGANTGLNFAVVGAGGGGTTTNATNLAAAIARNGAAVGVTATSAGAVVTVTALTDGAEGDLVKLAEGLGGFTWAGTTLAGGTGTASIVAFNNLYSTQGSVGGLCNQNGPSVYWSYFTGTGTASTSVVLSEDGTKVAYVESAATGAILHVLQWKAGEGTGAGYPVAPDITVTSGDVWSADCTAGNSCISSLAFSGGFNDTNSSPFYNYVTDTLYVGDIDGNVHKFTGVFGDNSVLTEVTTGWPITVNAGTTLTSPVYDSVSGNIYVGDSTGLLSFIREVGSSVGSCTPAPCLNATTLQVGTGGAIVDSPLVDGSTGMVYAVNGTDTGNHGTILQATTDFTTSVVSFKIGGAAAGTAADAILYSGAFDNAYYDSAIPSIAGHMYVCGKDPAFNNRPAIYQLSFAPATAVLTSVGTPLTGLVTANNRACSPMTEFVNGTPTSTDDWIFFSVGNSSNDTAGTPLVGPCSGTATGCLISINVAGEPAWPPAAVSNTATLPGLAAGATSGIVPDNVSTSAQASSIYFSLSRNSTGVGPGLPSCNTTAVVGCAVKLTQSALQ
ncbi:MAG: hypothetical protein WA765_04945 [Candidatus Acidiferrum sp.]